MQSDLQIKLPGQGLIATSEMALVEQRKRNALREERKVNEVKETLMIPSPVAGVVPESKVSSSGNVGNSSGGY